MNWDKAKNAIAIFIFLDILMYLGKPRLMFTIGGKMKPFGLGYDRNLRKRTLFTYGSVSIYMAIMIFTVVMMFP